MKKSGRFIILAMFVVLTLFSPSWVMTKANATETGATSQVTTITSSMASSSSEDGVAGEDDVNKVQEKNHSLEYLAGFCAFFFVLGASFTAISYRWEIT